MAWDFSTPPEVQEELDWMREFVDDTIIPLELFTADLNQAQLDALFEPLKQQVRERGLWAAHLPPEHGGQGRGQMHLALMHEVLGRSDLAPEVFGCQAPDSGNAELIAAGANDTQRKRWLYPLMRGEIRSSFSLTEFDNAGSDPTGITTRCERDGEHWVLNGHKWFASNASVADILVVMAVTDPDAAPHQRAAMLVVPRGTPGLVHGDYRFDNVVLNDAGQVIAVLDWELCTIGDPLADFVWSLGYWAEPGEPLSWLQDPPTRHPAFPSRERVLALYSELSGTSLEHFAWYRVFSWWKQACIVEGVYNRLQQGARGGMAVESLEQIATRVETYLETADALWRQ